MRTVHRFLAVIAIIGCRGDQEAKQGVAPGSNQVRSPDDPGALVAEYVRRDGLGEFQGPSAWLDSHTTFQSLGWDQGVVMVSSEISGSELREDSATVRVTYEWLAVIGGDDRGNPRVVPRDSIEVVTFELIKGDGTWRIAGPDLAPHVDVRTVLQNPRLTPNQRRDLQEAVRSRP